MTPDNETIKVSSKIVKKISMLSLVCKSGNVLPSGQEKSQGENACLNRIYGHQSDASVDMIFPTRCHLSTVGVSVIKNSNTPGAEQLSPQGLRVGLRKAG